MIHTLFSLIRKLVIGAVMVMLTMIYADRFLPDGIRYLHGVNDRASGSVYEQKIP
ncbi:MAG: hypothetical protein HQL84_02275 [Magnetococcales bacterium]|nr:hypothetical protein [Magnetococcales bacterium]MBF0148853.1 hypothetical protein [Magnetococcales bacterium]MBF0173147.1 hypothetical protein [Magnetococcales bacterium]MBF0346366.1 hypothetical protein [Magnetococcales bacterium]MBF0629812.1 hypothetical protein [Magnetococcales bacterium]